MATSNPAKTAVSEATAESGAADKNLDRIQELMSYLLDDSLEASQTEELNKILLEDSSARACCFDMAMLHADLMSYFQVDKSGGKDKLALPQLSGLPGFDASGATVS